MRHRLQHKLFDRKKRSKSRSPSTFIKTTLHSKSTYFYRWESKVKNSRILNLSKMSYVVPSVCSLALLIGGIIILNPTIQNHTSQVSALATSDGGGGTGSTEGSGNDYEYFPKVSLELHGNADQRTEALANSVTYRANNFTVAAADVDGYSVYVQANNGFTGQLKHEADPSLALNGVGKEVPPENFSDNTWGFAIAPAENSSTIVDPKTMLYNTVPENGAAAFVPGYVSQESDETKDFTLAFAARFGDEMPSGDYKTQVILSVAAGAKQVTGFGGIYTMQDMTSQVCKSVDGDNETAYTGRLEDTRDGKTYWVAKLKDGNCWMTQNLDYDGGGTRIETPTGWGSPVGSAQYYDPGMFVDTLPVKTDGQCETQTGLDAESCQKIGWTDVSKWSASITPMSTVLDSSKRLYDAHYLIGNYYSWYAATAGSANSVKPNETAQESICPTGWGLPSSAQYSTMLGEYGVGSRVTGTADGKDYDIRKDPLYFIMGGNMRYNTNYSPNSYLDYVGYVGDYWTPAMANVKTNIYILDIGGQYKTVNPHADTINGYLYNDHAGLSIRCIAK